MMQLKIKDMDVSINVNSITSIVGPSNSGKTLLLKKLVNKCDNKDVFIDDVCISEYDINFLKHNFVVCFDDNEYLYEYVSEMLISNYKRLGYSIKECNKAIEEINKYFKISMLFDEKIENLKYDDRILIKILSFLIIKPQIFGIDNLLCYLSKERVNQIIKYIKNNNITLINVTSDSEFLLQSDDVIVMSNLKAIMCSNAHNVLNGNSILPYLGIKLPFVIELSNNLMIYDVVKKEENKLEKLVNKIWK